MKQFVNEQSAQIGVWAKVKNMIANTTKLATYFGLRTNMTDNNNNSVPHTISREQKKQNLLKKKTSYFATEQQNKKRNILDNLYDIKIESLLGKIEKNKLYYQINTLIINQIIKLDSNISVQHFAYALTMSRTYEKDSIIQKSMRSSKPMSKREQKNITSYILGIGNNAINLRQKNKTSAVSGATYSHQLEPHRNVHSA